MMNISEVEQDKAKKFKIGNKQISNFIREKLNKQNESVVTINYNSGITMIALIVIIVVLLILASISISVLRGNNGIISKSQDSKEQHEVASEKETLKLAVSEAYQESAKKKSKDKEVRVDAETLKNVLSGYDEISEIDTDEDGVEITFKESGRIYYVDTEGNVTEETQKGDKPVKIKKLSAEEVAKDPVNNFGKYVDYIPNCTTDVKWQLFYANSTDIYLISSDYIEVTNLPPRYENGKPTSNTPVGVTGKTRNADAYVSGYTGTANITDKRLQALNSSFFNQKFTSTAQNSKSVAYMMDIDAWNSKFKDTEGKADYVIGGPTIELLFTAYNLKHNTNDRYQAKAFSGGFSLGYKVSNDAGKNFSYYYNSENLQKDDVYVINSKHNTNNTWIASPAAIGEEDIYEVSNKGKLICPWTNDTAARLQTNSTFIT